MLNDPLRSPGGAHALFWFIGLVFAICGGAAIVGVLYYTGTHWAAYHEIAKEAIIGAFLMSLCIMFLYLRKCLKRRRE